MMDSVINKTRSFLFVSVCACTTFCYEGGGKLEENGWRADGVLNIEPIQKSGCLLMMILFLLMVSVTYMVALSKSVVDLFH
jgi:hypothetical protein